MRFLSLALRPYGAFLDLEFDFSGEDSGGLHLIHGPNGAGKSTTLRAIRAALYGLAPGQDATHFLSNQLRLHVHLKHSSGATIRYCRRTAKRQPLWSANDDEALAVEELTPFLGGLETFHKQSF